MALVESSIRSENGDDESGADVVCEKLCYLGDNHPGNRDDLPISYLRLEAMITEKRNYEQSILVPHEDMKQSAKDCGIDECQVALDFFHDIGMIIDPSKYKNITASTIT